MALLPSYLSGPIGTWVGDNTPLGYDWEANPQRLDPLAGYNYWNLNPEFAAFDQGLVNQKPNGLTGSVEMEVIGQNPDGSWIVGRKTGDKEFSAFQYSPDDKGGFTLNEKPLYTYEKDTNWADPRMYAMALAAAVPTIAPMLGFGASTMPAIGGVGEIASMGPQFATLAGTGSGASGLLGGATAASTGLTDAQIADIVAAEGGYSSLPSYGATGTVPFADKVANIGLGSAITDSIGLGSAGDAASTVGKVVGGATSAASNLPDWLKWAAPLLGGGLAAWEASQANGQQNPTDAWTRDWARNKLNNPQAAPQPVTGQYRDKMMGMLGQQNPAIAGLLGKRYY